MPVTVRPLSDQNFWSAIKIRCDAFQDLAFAQIIRHQGITPQVVDWYADKARPNFGKPGHFFFEATDDETGRLLGICFSQRFDKAARIADQSNGKPAEEPVESVPFIDVDAQNLVGGIITKSRQATMGDRDYWATHVLAVSEESRGRGVGTLLLKWVTDQADAEGWPCYLDSTPAGLALYRKSGYVVQNEVSRDLNHWGVNDTWRIYPMIRAAKSAVST